MVIERSDSDEAISEILRFTQNDCVAAAPDDSISYIKKILTLAEYVIMRTDFRSPQDRRVSKGPRISRFR